MGESCTGAGFDKNPQNINRSGRPKKGTALTDVLNKFMELQDVQDGEKRISRKEALAHKIFQLAIGGNMAAIKYIYDRIDGTPVQTVDMHTVDENMVDVLNRIHEEKQGDNE